MTVFIYIFRNGLKLSVLYGSVYLTKDVYGMFGSGEQSQAAMKKIKDRFEIDQVLSQYDPSLIQVCHALLILLLH